MATSALALSQQSAGASLQAARPSGRRATSVSFATLATPDSALRSRGTSCSYVYETELSLKHPDNRRGYLQGNSKARRQPVLCGAGTSCPGEERESCGSDGYYSLSIPATGMAKGLGSFGGATLERSKLDTSRQTQTAQPKLDNSGGGGGIGKNIFNGGGGDGDDGDDDDYFDDFGDDGDGDGDGDNFFRAVIAQLYDREAIKAVMQEWFRDIGSLPAVIRQSVLMGLFSSAQLVRFFAMDVRPNVTRAVTRTFPLGVSRGIVGRLMADPAFVQKFIIEQGLTVASSMYWEAQQRGKNFVKELDLVLINTACLMGATGAAVYLLAPTRSYGALHKFPWQNMLHQLPNHVFDASGPQRQYTLGKRAAGAAAKAAELCGVGVVAGAAISGLGNAAVWLRRRSDPDFQPSAPIPSMARSSGGFAASMGVFFNLRYQAIGGIDRYFFERSVHLLQYIAVSAAARLASKAVGEPTRLWLQGLPGFDEKLRQQPRQPPFVASQKPKKKRIVRRKKLRQAGPAGGPVTAATA